jgi:hypothetical protein
MDGYPKNIPSNSLICTEHIVKLLRKFYIAGASPKDLIERVHELKRLFPYGNSRFFDVSKLFSNV